MNQGYPCMNTVLYCSLHSLCSFTPCSLSVLSTSKLFLDKFSTTEMQHINFLQRALPVILTTCSQMQQIPGAGDQV